MRYLRIILISLLISVVYGCAYVTQGLYPDRNRGALLTEKDTAQPFTEGITEIVYPSQGWNEAESLWFYNTTQGSNLMPYNIFLHLEQADNREAFRDNKNIRKFRYLTQKSTFGNPDGLPLGWVKDTYRGKDYIGLTCAACHTGQVNYGKYAIRIDGGPTLADMETMLLELEAALKASLRSNDHKDEKFSRLADAVFGSRAKNDKALTQFTDELQAAYEQIKNYNQTNLPAFGEQNQGRMYYGYARLDAFGRIFNRILEHINPHESVALNPPNAPVSYPFLWDTPYHDFVQWNGIADNGATLGLGPLGRNIGEVLGVFASIDIDYKKEKNKDKLRYYTSADTLNLARLERHLKKLQSPSWRELSQSGVLPEIDEQLAEQGKRLFTDYACVACHADIDRSDNSRRVVAQFTSHKNLGTDRTMADNAINYCGNSGLLINQENAPCLDQGQLDTNMASVASLLSNTVTGVIKSSSEKSLDFAWTRDWMRKIYVGALSIFGNPIRDTQRHVDLKVANKQAISVYKGRPLNGIWATAPYLHNGSVPNLYDLFLPACEGATYYSEQDKRKCRPEKFSVGNPELDPINVGFEQSESQSYPGLFTFDVSLPGNSNKGHEYAAGKTPSPIMLANGEFQKDDEGNVIFRKTTGNES